MRGHREGRKLKGPIVIGLTGPNAAGKGEAAALLGRRGFAYHSLSDVVREEATARGLGHEREALIQTGNALRAAGGAGVLGERMLGHLGARDVVDSIRNPEEVRALRAAPGFVLLGVTAPIELRFERARARARAGDGTTLEEFRRREAMENTTDPARQQLAATFALADVTIDNSGGLDQLESRIDRLLADLEKR
jgi:dephospho-CoA kinase